MNAYIIASRRSGIPGIVGSIFPGCTVQTWRENPATVPDQIIRAMRFVKREIAAGSDHVTDTAIREHLRVDPSNYGRQVKKHPTWATTLEAAGMEFYAGRGRTPGGVRTTLIGGPT